MRQLASAHVGPVRLTLLLAVALLVSALLSAIAAPAHRAAAQSAPAATNSDVNMRTGPGEWYDILTVVPAGAAVTIDGDAVDGFSPVTYNGLSGWVSVGFLVADGSGAVAPAATSAYQSEPTVSTTGDATVVYDDGSGALTLQSDRRNRNRGNGQPPAASDAPIANPGAPATNEQEIIAIIHQAADAYGQSREVMVRVARCESSLNPRAVDPSGSYHGLFQFVPSTFAGTPYGDQDIYDPWANAHAAAWMWSEGRKYEWVCQ